MTGSPRRGTDAGQTVGTRVPESTPTGQVMWWSRHSPDDTAIWDRDHGVWRRQTFRQLEHDMRVAAGVLHGLGLRRGGRVAIHSSNRPEWVHVLLGAQMLGAIPLGIYPTSSPEEVEHILRDARPDVLVLEGDAELDKYFSLSADTAAVPAVVVLEPREIGDFEVDAVWPELAGVTQPLDEGVPVDPDDCAQIVYTSGTTAAPKGAMLSYRNLAALQSGLSLVFDTGPSDILLSYLPLCHVAEQVITIYLGICRGATVAFAQSIQTVYEDAVVVQPTVFAGVPRVLEKLVGRVEVGMQDAGPVRRAALAAAKRMADVPVAGALARFVVLRRVARMIGLGAARFVFCAGAPVSPRVLSELQSLGLEVVEGYGLTESSSVVVSNRPGLTNIGTVGRPLPTAEVTIDENGEIRFRGDAVFLGYWNAPEATASAIEDGWLRSGDIGEWIGGAEPIGDWDGSSDLRITGRIKEIMITSGGKNIAPSQVEHALLSSQYISQVVAIADRRPYLTALIEIDEEAVGRWAAARNIGYPTYRGLTTAPEVKSLIADEVNAANQTLARVSQVRRFAILPDKLSQQRGEVTATSKLRRKVIEESYEHLVADLYSNRGTAS